MMVDCGLRASLRAACLRAAWGRQTLGVAGERDVAK